MRPRRRVDSGRAFMLISIVIVNYRSWDHLGQCLESLLASEGRSTLEHEIIVVDNDSADGRFEAFADRFPRVAFHANSGNHGFAHGCNLGARHAQGDLLLFLNPDVVADLTQIERMVEVRRQHPEVAILSARQIGRSGRAQKAFDAFPGPFTSFSPVRTALRLLRPSAYPNPRGRHRDLVHCDWVSGSLLLIGAADFERLGGWSEDFWMYMEDTDLCTRARERGMTVAFTPVAEFVHLHGGASRQNDEITAITKSEAVISKHVYISKHFTGRGASFFHAVVALKRLSVLALSGLLDRLTFRAFRHLRDRSQMLRILWAYYARSLRSGTWLSSRSINFAHANDGTPPGTLPFTKS